MIRKLSFLALSAALTGCAQTPQTAGTNPVAPVAQAGGIYAPTWITLPATSPGQPVTMTFQVGHSSDGNTEAKGGSQRADARQTTQPAVGDKAIEALKPVPDPLGK